MAIAPMYLPTPGQPNAATRAAAVGATLTGSTVPPVYATAVTGGGGAPGVVAEYGGQVVFVSDANGQLTAQQVTAAIAPLGAQQAADQATNANGATVLTNLLAHQQQVQTWLTNNPAGATLNAVQTLAMMRGLNALIQLLLQQNASTNLT